ncbi:MAG: sugar ABC transporter permease [Ruminococcaceae bacterium]|nr:sugar ABC transporter permease [Oscillospiraceae bacterium]
MLNTTARPDVNLRAAKELERKRLKSRLKRNASLYLLVAPVIIWFIVFSYIPMTGIVMAFKDYAPARGIFGSPFVGLKHFEMFFGSYYFGRLLRNTLTLSISYMVTSFPAAILFALLINEIGNLTFKKTVQTITYMPHFISMVVLCGMVREFIAPNGIVNDLIAAFGGERADLLSVPSAFPPIYVLSGLWQQMGWNSIIYLAALQGVDQELYESAYLDGAGKLRQTISITIPCIMPTIVIMFILGLGGIMNVGYEKIILLYNPTIYETADIISSFVYRKGLFDMQYSFSTAVGLFNSLTTCVLVITANTITRKLDSSMGLW